MTIVERLPDVVFVVAVALSLLTLAQAALVMSGPSGRFTVSFWVGSTALWIAWVMIR